MVINIDSNNTNKIYSFLGFHVNPQQRSVTQGTQAVVLSKKSFDMLVVLLQRHGELITKDELLAAVWPNQFITDSALSKQIARLRSTFDSQESSESFIETIRGVGIRLIVDVKVVHNQSDSLTSKTLFKKYLTAAGILLVVGFFLLQPYTRPNLVADLAVDPVANLVTSSTVDQIHKVKALESTIANKKSINVAVIPAQKTDEWLGIGGLNYLSELLQNHAEIEAISPNVDWFSQDKNNVLALQLSQADNIDYVLIVNIIKQQSRLIANISLRNKHGILATGELQAATLSNLFEKLDSWATLQLNITSGVVFANLGHSAQVSDFALESYLRGLAAARNRNFTQSAQFLQTAVNQDKNFFTVWLLLAEVEAELGNYAKALAITNTIAALNNFDPILFNDLYNVKARVLIYMDKLDEAETWLKKSMDISAKQNDIRAMIVSLSSQVLIHERNSGLNAESLAIIKKQLLLTKQYIPLPSKIAELNHNLAIVYQYMHDYDNAQTHIHRAIEQFKKVSNSTGLLSSYRVLADIYYDLAQTGKALNVLEKADDLVEAVDAPLTIAPFYMSKARNLYEQGFRKKALYFIEKLQDMGVKYANNEAKVIALIIQAELQVTYNDIDAGKDAINKLLKITSINPQEYPANIEYIAAIDMYISARWDEVKSAREKTASYLKSYPSLKQSIALHLRRIEAHLLAREGYRNKAIDMLNKLMNDYIEQQYILYAMYVGYEILEFQWQHDMEGYLKTLNRVQELVSFDYPILKFRAKYFAYKKDFLNAVILMQELKPKAREFWNIDDQLLLEEYQQKAQGISKS